MDKRLVGWAVLAAISAVMAMPARGAERLYSVILNGPSESPANASPGTGVGTIVYDDVAQTLRLQLAFSGLTGTVTQTHFHAATTTSGLPDNNPIGETPNQAASAAGNAGIAIGNTSLPGFPLGVSSGTYLQTLSLNDPSIYGAGFLAANGGTPAGARETFLSALDSGRTYWNVHSSTFGGGEIRGFPVFVVPEPGTMGLMGIAAMAICSRRVGRRS